MMATAIIRNPGEGLVKGGQMHHALGDKRVIILMICILVNLVGRLTVAYAQDANSVSETSKYQTEKMVSLWDSLVTVKMEAHGVPGVAVVAVSGDAILYSKGFGYANTEAGLPVQPDQTIFRLASISKVVTATAVMIAAGEGAVILREDVNSYLNEFRVPDRNGSVINLRHLLTHTAGFDDKYIGKSVPTHKSTPSLESYLQEDLPDRVMPPGEIFSYSNQGIALAGYVVGEATGQDFAAYCAQHLFTPLQMPAATFRLEEGNHDRLARGYVDQNGTKIPFPVDHLKDYPAGQLLATPNEFAHFMMMHLNRGKFKDNRILEDSVVASMQSVQFKHHPRLHSAVGYAFMLWEHNGIRIVGHDGGYPGIQTRMWLMPDKGMGIFIAVNQLAGDFMNEISYGFIDRFFQTKENGTADQPAGRQANDDITGLDEPVDRFTGTYRMTRYPRATMDKMGVLMGQVGHELTLWQDRENHLMMFDHTGNERRLVQVEPLLFRSLDDDYYMSFRENNSGSITHLFTDGVSAFEKTSWVYTAGVQRYVWGICLLALFGYFIIYLLQNLRSGKSAPTTVDHWVGWGSGLLLLHFLQVGLVVNLLIPHSQLMGGFPYGLPDVMYFVQLFPWLAAGFSLVFIYQIVKRWREGGNFGWWAGYYGLFVVTLVIYFNVLHYWNLLGFRF